MSTLWVPRAEYSGLLQRATSSLNHRAISQPEVDGLLFAWLFFETGFLWALEPVLELALVEHAGLELTEIHLPLPPECWD